MGTPLIRCRELTVGWHGKAVAGPIDMAIERGRFVAVVGRNGSGKSTWFQTLLGLIPPVSGRVERSPELRRVAYVPQSDAFDPILPLGVRDVVRQGTLHGADFLRPFGGARQRAKVERALEEAGVAELGAATFRDLSKGQRQRVMFARMLAAEAELALLDEPTAAMDVVAEREAVDRLAELARDHDIAVVMVSHGPEVAERHADDVLVFDRQSGAVEFGPREDMLSHRAFVAYHDPHDHDECEVKGRASGKGALGGATP